MWAGLGLDNDKTTGMMPSMMSEFVMAVLAPPSFNYFVIKTFERKV
jgi:hypothetical protein